MKRRIALFVVGTLLLLVPSQAMAYLCLSVCNQYAPCDRVCQMYGGGPFTTCGAWGDCQGGGLAHGDLAPDAAQVGLDSSANHLLVEKNVTWQGTHDGPVAGDFMICPSR